MEKKHKFSYNDIDDSLIVSNRAENEMVKDNFEIGDIIFSLTGKGKIVSIEIMDASEQVAEPQGIFYELKTKQKSFSL